MSGCLSKIIKRSIIIVCIIITIATLTINVVLAISKSKIAKSLYNELTYSIRIQDAYFIFPDVIILRGIVFTHKYVSSQESSFKLPAVVFKIDYKKSLNNKFLSFSTIRVNSASLDNKLFIFFKENIENIINILKRLPRGDIKVEIKNAKHRRVISDLSRLEENFTEKESDVVQESSLDKVKTKSNKANVSEKKKLLGFCKFRGFVEKSEKDDEFVFSDFIIDFKGNELKGRGVFNKNKIFNHSRLGKKKDTLGKPLYYDFEGKLGAKGVILDNIIFKSEDIYSKLWGDLRGPSVSLNGFAFIETNQQKMQFDNFIMYIYKKTRALLGKFKKPSVANKLSNKSIYLLDIDCQADFTYSEIILKKIFCEFNNFPINVSGKISFDDHIKLDIKSEITYPNISGKRKSFNKVKLKSLGVYKNRLLQADSDLDIDFIKKENSNIALEKIKAKLDDVTIYINKKRSLIFKASKGNVSFWTNGNEHKISFSEYVSTMNLLSERFRIGEVKAKMYNGILNGRFWINIEQSPYKMMGWANLVDLDINKMSELLVHFAKFYGNVSSEIHFSNTKEFYIEGDATIKEGMLTKFRFFNWIANTFKSSSIREVHFKNLYTKYLINAEGTVLKDIRLKSKDVNMEGFFGVDKNSLVDSKFSIMFSRDVFKDSSKGRALLKVFDKDLPFLTFDFQLSGNQHSMNLQWVENEYKRKIMERLPDFIERRIERKIDQSIKDKRND